jgi:hypothetical protein
MREEIRNYNVQVVQKALTENRGLKSARLRVKQGKSLMVAIRNKDGSITTDREKSLRDVQNSIKSCIVVQKIGPRYQPHKRA